MSAPLFLPARANVADEEIFAATLVFGAAALASYKGKFLTVVRNAAGNYTVTLPKAYRRRTGVTFGWGKYAAGAVFFPVILSDTLTTNGKFIFEVRTEAGVATDPASGNELDVRIGVTVNTLND
jgi:hypothetical protein